MFQDVRLPESTDLLHSQLVEARHRVEIEAAQRAKSLTDAEKIIENAKQMVHSWVLLKMLVI